MGSVGIDTAKNYAQKSGISFDKNDNNLSLALGGMTYGTTLKQLTNSYLPFVNKGKFILVTSYERPFVDVISVEVGSFAPTSRDRVTVFSRYNLSFFIPFLHTYHRKHRMRPYTASQQN